MRFRDRLQELGYIGAMACLAGFLVVLMTGACPPTHASDEEDGIGLSVYIQKDKKARGPCAEWIVVHAGKKMHLYSPDGLARIKVGKRVWLFPSQDTCERYEKPREEYEPWRYPYYSCHNGWCF